MSSIIRLITTGIEAIEDGQSQDQGVPSQGIWRPPQWQDPAVIMITLPPILPTPEDVSNLILPLTPGAAATYSPLSGIGTSLPVNGANYVFDTVIAAEHDQELVVTEHPVQSGASISDHAYVRPARLVLDIGMSDAMDAYFTPSTWTGSQSKSVSCYQTLLALQAVRIPLQITTKLRTYSNMLIVSASPRETSKTITGLRARITFQQIFMATIAIPAVSARPQDTNSTDLGQVNPQPLSDAQQIQNLVNKATDLWNAIGAGGASSVPIGNSNLLPGK